MGTLARTGNSLIYSWLVEDHATAKGYQPRRRSSVSPAIEVGRRTKYGYKWWLYEYGDENKMAWAGNGFGGQFPIVIPEYNIVAVFNAWNITGRGLGPMEIIRRLISTVEKD